MKIKNEAQRYLEQGEKLDALIKNKLIEKQQWRDIALGMTANMEGEKVQSSGSQSKMENAVVKCVDIESEIECLINKLIATKKDIISIIEQVDNPTEYNVLHMKYIQYMTYEEIAERYGKEYGWATTTHGRALKSVQAVLNQK